MPSGDRSSGRVRGEPSAALGVEVSGKSSHRLVGLFKLPLFSREVPADRHKGKLGNICQLVWGLKIHITKGASADFK